MITLADAVNPTSSRGLVLRETVARALGDSHLRRLLMVILSRTGVLARNRLMQESPIDPLAVAYNEGWRALGMELLEMILDVDPMAYAQMVSDVMVEAERADQQSTAGGAAE